MFKGKVVVITGSSNGIGAAVAKVFSAEGASVAINGRNRERLSAVAKECRNNGAEEVLEIVADLSKEDAVRDFATKVKEQFDRIDILVNNAASAVVCSFSETTMKEFDRIFNTNVRSHFLLSQLLLMDLSKSQGCIINISSITATSMLPKGIAYGMSKAAINHFTEALAFECSKCGVRVNGVSPSAVKTNQLAGDTKENKLTQQETDATLAFMACAQPLGTLSGLISADDVAKSVLFLASPSACCITGHTIKIEAGYNAYHALSAQ